MAYLSGVLSPEVAQYGLGAMRAFLPQVDHG